MPEDRSPRQPSRPTAAQRRRALAALLLLQAGGQASTVNGKIQRGKKSPGFKSKDGGFK